MTKRVAAYRKELLCDSKQAYVENYKSKALFWPASELIALLSRKDAEFLVELQQKGSLQNGVAFVQFRVYMNAE